MLKPHLKPVQVVVAYDFSPCAQEAVLRAVDLACRAPQHVLHIVTAIDPHAGVAFSPHTGDVDYAYAEKIQGLVSSRVADAFAGRDSATEVEFYVHARIGKVADEVLHAAQELGADLIMVGSHGKTGVERVVLGSVSERIVREARCAVMVARAKGYADVELAHMVPNPHARTIYRPPHRYVYAERRVSIRPDEWPQS